MYTRQQVEAMCFEAMSHGQMTQLAMQSVTKRIKQSRFKNFAEWRDNLIDNVPNKGDSIELLQHKHRDRLSEAGAAKDLQTIHDAQTFIRNAFGTTLRVDYMPNVQGWSYSIYSLSMNAAEYLEHMREFDKTFRKEDSKYMSYELALHAAISHFIEHNLTTKSAQQ